MGSVAMEGVGVKGTFKLQCPASCEVFFSQDVFLNSILNRFVEQHSEGSLCKLRLQPHREAVNRRKTGGVNF